MPLMRASPDDLFRGRGCGAAFDAHPRGASMTAAIVTQSVTRPGRRHLVPSRGVVVSANSPMRRAQDVEGHRLDQRGAMPSATGLCAAGAPWFSTDDAPVDRLVNRRRWGCYAGWAARSSHNASLAMAADLAQRPRRPARHDPASPTTTEDRNYSSTQSGQPRPARPR